MLLVLRCILTESSIFCAFFFNDTATTEIYTYGHTLSLHDALPILVPLRHAGFDRPRRQAGADELGQLDAAQVQDRGQRLPEELRRSDDQGLWRRVRRFRL